MTHLTTPLTVFTLFISLAQAHSISRKCLTDAQAQHLLDVSRITYIKGPGYEGLIKRYFAEDFTVISNSDAFLRQTPLNIPYINTRDEYLNFLASTNASRPSTLRSAHTCDTIAVVEELFLNEIPVRAIQIYLVDPENLLIKKAYLELNSGAILYGEDRVTYFEPFTIEVGSEGITSNPMSNCKSKRRKRCLTKAQAHRIAETYLSIDRREGDYIAAARSILSSDVKFQSDSQALIYQRPVAHFNATNWDSFEQFAEATMSDAPARRGVRTVFLFWTCDLVVQYLEYLMKKPDSDEDFPVRAMRWLDMNPDGKVESVHFEQNSGAFQWTIGQLEFKDGDFDVSVVDGVVEGGPTSAGCA